MDIWDEVVEEFNDELNKLRTGVCEGQSDNFAHYRQLVGHIYGLEWARNKLTDIVKKRIYEEEDN